MWSRERPVYRGIPMRSRLEVAWAAYLDAEAIPWLYEPVKFRRYTPDFGIGPVPLVFVEVKAPFGPMNKIESCPVPLIVVWGPPTKLVEIAVWDWSTGLVRHSDWSSALQWSWANVLSRVRDGSKGDQ